MQPETQKHTAPTLKKNFGKKKLSVKHVFFCSKLQSIQVQQDENIFGELPNFQYYTHVLTVFLQVCITPRIESQLLCCPDRIAFQHFQEDFRSIPKIIVLRT
jgi:hypothetical protein